MNDTIANRNNHLKIRSYLLVCLFLVMAILAVYWQVRNHDFINYDDDLYVTINPHVQAGFTLDSITWAFTSTHASNWHPLTWLSHMLDCRIYGMNPGRHHLTNVLLHILNTLLLFLVFKRMTGDLWQCGFVAALFALHPLHVESVAWVAERKDVLSTFFWMLTVWSYLRYVERSGLNRYLPVLFFFILGLMAKPMLVTLPFVLLLLDYWPLKRFRLGSSEDSQECRPGRFCLGLVWEKIPLFLLSAGSSVITYMVQKSSGAVSPLDVASFKVRIANAMISYVSYIGKMIWPHNLAVLYPYPKAILLWKVVGASLLLVVMSIVVFRMVKTKPYFAVGWLWYVGTLVPVIGFVQVGGQAMADRYTYVSLIGLFIIIAWGVHDILAKWRYKEIILTTSALFVLSSFLVCAWFQVRNWRNSITLFENAIDVTKNNYVAHDKLGEALAAQGKTDAAIRYYSEALRIWPEFVEARFNLGVLLREDDRLNEAIDHFFRVLRFKPNFAEAHCELGNTLKEQGKFPEAVRHYLEAISIKPEYAMAYNNLGVILAHQEKNKAAISHFYEAIRIDSGYVRAYCNLGKVFANQGRIEEAILNYRKALNLSTDMSQALYYLSWILATYEDGKYRNGEEAVKLAEKLCRIAQYKQPLALDALAAAYAESGRFDDAVLTAKKGFILALHQGPEELVLGLKERLKLYRAGRPYRKPRSGEGRNRYG
jgi:tetratricopeptide (TPR) repeat protein